jgi:putative tricarboxylic transport membrane protein
METLHGLAAGWELIATPAGLVAMVIGLTVGFVAGVLPGFSGPNAAALLLPISLHYPLEIALALIISIYAGTTFGGTIPAILINVPGEGGAAATALDGYPMAKAGKAQLAIGIARMASVLGGVIGVGIAIILIHPISAIAIRIGPPELFIVAMIGVSVCATLIGDDVAKGLTVAFLGMLISAMSVGPISAEPRLDFGIPELYDQIPLVAAVVGIFALSEMMLLPKEVADLGEQADYSETDRPARPRHCRGQLLHLLGLDNIPEIVRGVRVTLGYPWAVLQGSLIGLLIGTVPGIGSSVSNLVAYGAAKRWAKDKSLFGKGHPVGIIASEASDNALAGGSLIPTLTLGIPGNATSAVMLAALYLYGIQPGPQFMSAHAAEAYAVLLAAFFSSVLILPLGIVLSSPLVYFTKIKTPILVPATILISIIGAYATNASMFDVAVALAFGLLTLLLRVFNYPIIPLFLGLILGPLAENNFVRSLALARYHFGIFWQSTPSKILLVVLAGLLITGIVRNIRQRRAGNSADEHTVVIVAQED